MISPLRPFAAAFAAAALSLAPALPSALAQNSVQSSVQTSRIAAQAVSSSAPRAALTNTVSPRARAAADLGAAPADRILSSVTLRFNMSAAQSSALDALIAAQQNPQSAQYRQWLTPEQYAAQFGLSSSDIAKVTSWLESQGLTVTGVARGHSFVTVSGTVAKLNAAFATSIHSVSLNGEQHIANLSEPALPAAIAAVTSTITGLSDIRIRPHAHPHFTSSISGSHFVAPGDFYTIYDINPLLTSNVNGAGITIAVAGQTDILLTDVAAFRAASGLPANAPTIKLIGTDPGTPLTSGVAEDQVEASLDVEWSGAVAPSATILYVNSTDVLGGSLTQIIDQNLAPIATVSYGDCETNFGSSNIAVFNQLFRQAAAQGQTIAGPGGDSGATDCDYQTNVATQGLAVDFPASSPYVTGVGGTMFNEGAGSYWAAANGTAYNGSASALSYIPEAVWNESSSTNGLSGGGGGASAYFTKPTWQTGTGVPSDSARDVPDIAFNAAAGHDGYLYCQGGFCTNGYRNASSNLDVVGGTSVSTPAFAGMLALLEQKLNTKVGLVNPTLYALANSTYYTNVFHDVTVGSNVSPCTIGSPNCTTVITPCNGSANAGQGCIGYTAGTGYDLASGWGSLDVFNFVNDFPLVSPANFGLSTSAGATADVSLSPGTSTVTVKSGSVASGLTFTVSPVNSFVGIVNFALSTTSTTLNATYTLSADPVTITGSGSASTILTLSATQSTAKTGTGLFKTSTGVAANHPLPTPGRNLWTLSGSGVALAGLLFLAFPRSRSRWAALVLVLASIGILGTSGCSSGTAATPVTPPTTTTGGTTPGTYTILVTASGTNAAGIPISHTSTVTFIVQ